MLLLGPPHTIPGIAMLTLLSCNVLCHAQTKFNVIVEDFPCAPVVRELARTPALAEGSRPTLEPDYIHLRRFIDCEAQIVALGMWPGEDERQWIYGYRAPEISKTAYVVGIARAIAVVNRSNPVNALDYDQLRKILAGELGHVLGVPGDYPATGEHNDDLMAYGYTNRCIHKYQADMVNP